MKRRTYGLARLIEPDYMPLNARLSHLSNIATTKIECSSCGHITNRNDAKTESSHVERGKFEIERNDYYCSECDNWLCADEIAIVPEIEESEE